MGCSVCGDTLQYSIGESHLFVFLSAQTPKMYIFPIKSLKIEVIVFARWPVKCHAELFYLRFVDMQTEENISTKRK